MEKTSPKNKAIASDEAKNKAAEAGESFTFPDHDITIQAGSRQEAEEKLRSILAEREQ